MTTFVLVHGAWHGGWCWRDVAGRLQSAGHRVFAPTLTGLADRSHLLTRETGLETHILDVANLLGVAEVEAQLVGGGQHVVQLAGDTDLGPVGARQHGHRLLGPGQHGGVVDARGVQHRQHQALGLGQQGDQQVVGRDLGVGGGPGRLGGGRERLGRLERPAVGVQSHGQPSLVTGSTTEAGPRVAR